jgi:hypothetical protein
MGPVRIKIITRGYKEKGDDAMKIDAVNGDLRMAAERLFSLVREITGGDPKPSGGRYKARVDGRDSVYIEIIQFGGSAELPLASYRVKQAGDGVWWRDRG